MDISKWFWFFTNDLITSIKKSAFFPTTSPNQPRPINLRCWHLTSDIDTSASAVDTSTSDIDTSTSDTGTSTSDVNTSTADTDTSTSDTDTSTSDINTSTSDVDASTSDIKTLTRWLSCQASKPARAWPFLCVLGAGLLCRSWRPGRRCTACPACTWSACRSAPAAPNNSEACRWSPGGSPPGSAAGSAGCPPHPVKGEEYYHGQFYCYKGVIIPRSQLYWLLQSQLNLKGGRAIPRSQLCSKGVITPRSQLYSKGVIIPRSQLYWLVQLQLKQRKVVPRSELYYKGVVIPRSQLY